MKRKRTGTWPGVAHWMIPPAASWRRKSSGGLANCGLLAPLAWLGGALVLCLTASVVIIYWPGLRNTALAFQVAAVTAAAAALALTIIRVRTNLLDPLTHLRNWASRVRGGNLAARIPEPARGGEFAELARDINGLGDSLASLTRRMEEQVARQTRRIAQKSHSLEVLYDVAASINASRDLEDLLTRFLHILTDVVDAQAASVRLLTQEGELRLVASTGLTDEIVKRERLIPAQRCQCGNAALNGFIRCQDVQLCDELIEHPMFGDDNLEMIAVPLRYRDKNLGVYNLFVRQPGLVEREDVKALLTSIGQHLGTAIEKTHLEQEARRLALMEERTLLAHELHDSLAQTLASLRLHLQTLEGNLPEGIPRGVCQQVGSLKAGLDKANTELRQLLAHFRTPMDSRGIIPAIADMTVRLEKETGITTFFQNEAKGLELPPSHEVQVLHIVQEALSNIRKHSKAKHARVLLRADSTGNCSVLVEDDGQGMTVPYCSTQRGEHIGLAIMRERVARINGILSVESEHDEGTRVEFRFRCPSGPIQGVYTLVDRRETAETAQ